MDSNILQPFQRSLSDIQNENASKKRGGREANLEDDSVDRIKQVTKKKLPHTSSIDASASAKMPKSQVSKDVIYYCEKAKLLAQSVTSKVESSLITADDAQEIVSKVLREEKALAKAVQKKNSSIFASYIKNPLQSALGYETEENQISKAKVECEEAAAKAFDRILKQLSETNHENVKDRKFLLTSARKIQPLIPDGRKNEIMEKYAVQLHKMDGIEFKLMFLRHSIQKLMQMNSDLLSERQQLCGEIIEYCIKNELLTDLSILYSREEFRSILTADQLLAVDEALELDQDEKMDVPSLTKFDEKVLHILKEIGKAEKSEYMLSYEAQSFLYSIIGNLEFNKAAIEYLKKNKSLLGSAQKSGLKKAIDLSYKLDNEKKALLESVSKKVNYMLEFISSKVELPTKDSQGNWILTDKAIKALQSIQIPPEYRLTAREAGYISSAKNMKGVIHEMKGACDPQSSLGMFFEGFSDLLEKIKVLDRIVNLTTPYEDGDISFDNRIIEEKVYGRNLSWENRGQRLVTMTDYDHGATIMRNPNGGVSYAHVMGNFFTERISLDQFCYQDTYRLNWNKLLTPHGIEALKIALENAHSKGEYTNISSPAEFMKTLYQQEYVELIKDGSKIWGDQYDNPEERRQGSIKKKARAKQADNMDTFEDFSQVKKSLMEQKEIFCTEFVAKAISHSSSAARKKAFEFIKRFNPEAGITEAGLCRMPIKPKTNFSAMHAGRVMSDIQKFVDPVPKSPFFQKVVNTDTLSYSPFFI